VAYLDSFGSEGAQPDTRKTRKHKKPVVRIIDPSRRPLHSRGESLSIRPVACLL
jgi:hypothetical protein